MKSNQLIARHMRSSKDIRIRTGRYQSIARKIGPPRRLSPTIAWTRRWEACSIQLASLPKLCRQKVSNTPLVFLYLTEITPYLEKSQIRHFTDSHFMIYCSCCMADRPPDCMSFFFSSPYFLPPFFSLSFLSRGTTEIRTHRTHKNRYVPAFLLSMFGPHCYVPP